MTAITTATERASFWWNTMREMDRKAVLAVYMAGYASWTTNEGICANPCDEATQTDLWAAFQMGWQQAQEEAKVL